LYGFTSVAAAHERTRTGVFLNEHNISSIPGFAEPVASWSHLLAAVLFAVLSVRMLRRGWRGTDRAVLDRTGRMMSLGIFCFACVALFSVSGVYHLLSFGGAARSVLLRLDHSFIFVLIAATFTPPHVYLFKGLIRWGPLLLIWTIAFTGITMRAVFGPDVPAWLGVIIYTAMGWSGLIGGVATWRRYGSDFVEPAVIGGLVYTAGAAVQLAQGPVLIPGVVGSHELFHFAVIGGALSFWKFIYRFADGGLPSIRLEAPLAAEYDR
jgi:channel protein (hemolysin III family)